MLVTIIIFALVLSLLVFVHEAGHFFMARLFGVKVSEFGMGLPPRICGWQKFLGKWRFIKGDKQIKPDEPMVYSLNWIPVGGFVNIKGENGEEAAAEDSFGHKKIWQRIIILAAGVTMNVVLTVVLLTIGFAVGMPSSVNDNGDGGVLITQPQVQVAQLLENMPAEKAGVKVGDIVESVDGQKIFSGAQLKEYFATKENQPVAIALKRGQEEVKVSLSPVNRDGVMGMGVAIVDMGIKQYPLHLAIYQAILTTWSWIVMIALAVWALFMQLFGGAKSGIDFSGPVGIAVLTGQAAKMGYIYVLQFAALLSLNLALINILPFPALDGGRIAFLMIEKLRGKPVDAKLENLFHNIGFMLLMLLIVVVTFRDLIKYGAKIIYVLGRTVGL